MVRNGAVENGIIGKAVELVGLEFRSLMKTRMRLGARLRLCGGNSFCFGLSVTLVNDQHFWGDVAKAASIDDLSENVAWNVEEQR